MISLLTFKANVLEPYKIIVSDWSSEEYWRLESNLYMPVRSSTL